MSLAWGLYRAELKGPAPRTFGDALAGAWRWCRASASRVAPRWATAAKPRHIEFRAPIQSPIRRSLSGQAYAYSRAREAGRVTTAVGL